MLQDENISRQERDHFLLARAFLKGCEAELGDLREWVQQEILAVKLAAQIMEEMARTNPVKTKIRGVLDRVNEIDLGDLKSCVNDVETVIKSIKDRNYQSALGVHVSLEREMMRLRELVRELLDMRNTLDLLTAGEDED